MFFSRIEFILASAVVSAGRGFDSLSGSDSSFLTQAKDVHIRNSGKFSSFTGVDTNL